LEEGDLSSLSHGVNELKLKIINTDKNNHSSAIITLKNERLQAEISLSRYWESSDGVWLVKSYKRLNNSVVLDNPDFGIYLAKDNQLLISTNDIISYDPKTSSFKLSDEAVKRLDSYSAYGPEHTPKINNRLYQQEFLITLHGATLFSGVFWSSLSSASHNGLVLLDSMMFTTTKELTISTEYPPSTESAPAEQPDLIKYFKSIGKLAGDLKTASTTTISK
jgi:hypothetical protein